MSIVAILLEFLTYQKVYLIMLYTSSTLSKLLGIQASFINTLCVEYI